MFLELFVCLLLAHLVADFVLQSYRICKDKRDKKWCSVYHYLHAVIVFGLSWLVVFDIRFWWYALIIGVTHFAIDMWKSSHEENVVWFTVDQILHIAVIVGVGMIWCCGYDWRIPGEINLKYVMNAVAIIGCWKPANIFIKLTLKQCSVNMPEEQTSVFNAGALIGTIERWLILIFVCLQRYDALGLMIAAKSIIRFGDKETAKTEYVLAGTLLSLLIAVLAGLLICLV